MYVQYDAAPCHRDGREDNARIVLQYSTMVCIPPTVTVPVGHSTRETRAIGEAAGYDKEQEGVSLLRYSTQEYRKKIVRENCMDRRPLEYRAS